MQLAVTVVSPATGQQADVVIDAGSATAVADVAAEMDQLMHGQAAASPALFVGYHQVPGDMRLADSPIMDGCVVSIGDPAGGRRPEPAGVAEIRVASGPAAGTLHRLPFGAADIGGPPGDTPVAAAVAGAADIVIADPAIPSVALRVFVTQQGAQVAPFDGVRAWLDREPLDSAALWRPGQQVAAAGTGPDGRRPGRARRGDGVFPAPGVHAGDGGVHPGDAARQLRQRP
jgi:S-DNA-T family DNA segregation ATPase FtsK/SpoIIIE